MTHSDGDPSADDGFGEALAAALAPALEFERELVGGAMARVFVAREVALDRRVVAKVLPPSLAAGINRERFRREIQLAAQLQHPHIVPLFDSGESDGRVFYVMPYVMGESLGARLRRDPSMPLDLALRIAGNVARALAYAHAHRIVHRDIKPDNVLLSGDATGELHAMVSDFGLAKAIDASRSRASLSGDRTLTPFGGMVGTPRYMSPEQAVGDAVEGRVGESVRGRHQHANAVTGDPAGLGRFTRLELGRQDEAESLAVDVDRRCRRLHDRAPSWRSLMR